MTKTTSCLADWPSWSRAPAAAPDPGPHQALPRRHGGRRARRGGARRARRPGRGQRRREDHPLPDDARAEPPHRGHPRGVRHRRGRRSDRRAQPARLHARARLPPARPDRGRHRRHLRRAQRAARPGRPASGRPTCSTSSGLDEARFRPVGGFSTGMRQRTKLAQALVADPELVLLDEPTAGLDPLGREEMLDLVARLGGLGISVLLATHLLDDVQQVCDHVVMLDGGRLVVSGSTDRLLERTGRAHRRRRHRPRRRSSLGSRSGGCRRPPSAGHGGGAGRRRRRHRHACAMPWPTSASRCTA